MTKRNSNKPGRTARILTSTELAAAVGGRAWDGDYGFDGVGVIGDGTLSGGKCIDWGYRPVVASSLGGLSSV